MRRFLRVLILLCAIVTIYPSVVVSQVPIAVLDFEPKGVAEIEASALADRFRDELFILGQKSGKYRVMERGLMEDIMEEQNFQLSGCTSNECAVEVGKIIGVRQIIGGSISKVGDMYSVSARIISVETGEVLQVATYDYQGNIGTLMTQGMGEVVKKLINVESGEAVSARNIRGILYIDSSPDSADVWVDDNKIEGTTPALVEDQPVGNRHIVVKKGTYTAETTLHLAPGELKKIHLDLVSTAGNLRIVTTPAEAEAYFDNEHIGQSPVFLKDVPAGSHTITVQKPGYDSLTREVEIAEGATEEVQMSLRKITLPSQERTSLPDEAEISAVRNQIQRLRGKQFGMLSLGVISAAAGGYFKYSADQQYAEYQDATEDATDLHQQIQLEDTITYAAFGLGVGCLMYVVNAQFKIYSLKRNARLSVSSSGEHFMVLVSLSF